MYEEYLGEGYHDKVRKMLSVDDTLLPNNIIDADINIGAMKLLISPSLETMREEGKTINSEDKYKKLVDVALHYLCGVLCIALKSRTLHEPFNVPKYKHNWDEECGKFVNYANLKMLELIASV